ncbi:MAG TPA: guanylate kinase, partial [Oribacterium sp.]|nr:guanylate kinase [Oribacterium sp.]
PYTTRPIREGEQEGVEYHFVTDAQMDRFEREGRIIEERRYQTVYGPWRYATVDDGQITMSDQKN